MADTKFDKEYFEREAEKLASMCSEHKKEYHTRKQLIIDPTLDNTTVHLRSLPNIKISYSNEFAIWKSMIHRCTNPKNPSYADYGKRGITVCDRWLESFGNFLEDVGPRPDKRLSLDRINVNKGYSKDNCRWADSRVQMINRRIVCPQKKLEMELDIIRRKYKGKRSKSNSYIDIALYSKKW